MQVLPANVSTVQLYTVKPLTEYIITIKAFNKYGESQASYARATTPSYAPSIVQHAQILPVSPTEIHLKWEEPSRGHVTRYHIRYWRPGRREKQSAWMTGNFRNYVAGSLRKGSNYRFEIIPYNGVIPGEAVVMFTSTLEDRPDGPPLDIKLRALNESILVATWQPPDPELANGKIKGYRLVLKVKGGKRISSFRLSSSRRNFTFFDMDTSKIYQLRMAAITINGTGVLSSWVESTYSGSPNKPGLPERLIIKPDMTSISLSWSRPKFTGSQVHGYIVGYGQFIPEAYRVVLPRTQQNYTINFLRPNSKYIVSVRAFNQIGESQPSFRKVRTLKATLKNIPLLAPVQLRVQSDSPTSLMVSWVDPVLGSSQEVLEGRSYVIRYSPLSGESYKYTGTVSLHRKLTGLKPATSYEISVKAVIANISSDWSLPVLNSTHQTTPSSAPQNITVQPVMGNPTELQLSWTEPQHSNGKILEYFIYRSLNPSLASKEWEIVATDQQAIRLKGILPHKVYYFRLQARNRVGYGPLSDIAVYKPPKERRSAPSNLTISSIHDNLDSVMVAWQPPQTAQEEITGYRVHYATLENAERKQWMVKFEKVVNTIVEDLELNTTYHFKVHARYRNGFGPFSAAVTFKTPSEVTKQQPAGKFGSNDGAKFTPPTTESQVFTSLQTKKASENTFTNKVFPDKEQMLSSVPPQQTRTYEAFVPLDSHQLFPSSEMLRNITKPSDGSFNHSLIDANKEYSPADQHEEDGKGSVDNNPENLSVAPPAEEDQVYRYLAVNLENGKNSAPHSSEIQRSQRVLENTQLPLVESSTFFSEAHKSTRSVFEATQKPVSEVKSSRNETESVGETIFGRFQN
ncbi:neogenin [Plakobranchus ocellatus]|uniref:Neogenin n=1 Tax=Plakobranchus ocellatus TaxID=259542 RepID=A0AAV4DAJ6_9GAST|nr:neogenin [Plakobranchus ocellatus]